MTHSVPTIPRPASGPLMLAVVLWSPLLLTGCGDGKPEPPAASATGGYDPIQAEITTFCGACHNPPPPESFPRDAWYHEVEQGYGFFYDSGRTDLKPPPLQSVVQWYRDRAPEALAVAPTGDIDGPPPLRFEIVTLPAPTDATLDKPPSVAHLRVVPGRNAATASETADASLASAPADSLLICDMGLNGLFQSDFGKTDGLRRLTTLPHPAHAERTDLNGDGTPDAIVALLGSYLPEDHAKGQVVWLPSFPAAGTDAELAGADTEPVTLLSGIGRVADVQAGDFDGDGDQDLVVAEFGWHRTGGIHLLRQEPAEDGVPRFHDEIIDRRHGPIHVPVTDLDGDGDLDFVGLVSQEFEEISAWLNRGDGTFERQVIHLAGDPSYGSSGIQLVDLDQDGDTDVLYTNGDLLDSEYLKPFHGVQWLENRQDFPFRRHALTALPGAMSAQAGDLDGDGDLDIVAGAWISKQIRTPSPDPDGCFDTLILLEQTAPGRFRRSSLQRETALGFMTIALGDFDGDSRLDIAGGRFGDRPESPNGWIRLFLNRGPAK